MKYKQIPLQEVTDHLDEGKILYCIEEKENEESFEEYCILYCKQIMTDWDKLYFKKNGLNHIWEIIETISVDHIFEGYWYLKIE